MDDETQVTMRPYKAHDLLAADVKAKPITDTSLLTKVLYAQALQVHHHAAKEIYDLYPVAGIKILKGVVLCCAEKYTGIDSVFHPGEPPILRRRGYGHIAWMWPEDHVVQDRIRCDYQTKYQNNIRNILKYSKHIQNNFPGIEYVISPLIKALTSYELLYKSSALDDCDPIDRFIIMYAEGHILPRLLISVGRMIEHDIPQDDIWWSSISVPWLIETT